MANQFTFVISAVDKATAVVRKVNASIAATTKPVAAFGKELSELGRNTGLTQLGKSFSAVGGAVGNVVQKIASISAPLAAVTGVTSVAGVSALANEWARLGSEIGRTAQTIGVGTSGLQQLRGAAQLSGVSAESLTSGLRSLGDTMQDALYGRNQAALAMMNRLGITMHKTASGAVDVERAFGDIANAIQHSAGNPQVQALIARSFGLEDVLPLLRKGPKEIARLRDEASKAVMSPSALAAAKALQDSLVNLDQSAKGLWNTLGEKLSPVLTPIVTEFGQWVDTNKDWIATGIVGALTTVADALRSAPWEQIGRDVKEFGKNVNEVVQALGGWKVVAEGLMIFMATKWVAGMLIPIGVVAARLTALMVTATRLGIGVAAGAVGTAGVAVGTAAAVASLRGSTDDLNAHPMTPAEQKRADELRRQELEAWRAKHPYAPPDAVGAGGAGFGTKTPRGIRNNNPLNLQYVPGQRNVLGSDGRFGKYPTMEDGVTAAHRQLMLYQDRGMITLSQIIGGDGPRKPGWAPPGENDTAAYIKFVRDRTGIQPNEAVNVRNPEVATRLIAAMAEKENGKPIDLNTIRNGVATSLNGGQPVKIDVQVANAPPGTKVDVKAGPRAEVSTRVDQSMPPGNP